MVHTARQWTQFEVTAVRGAIAARLITVVPEPPCRFPVASFVAVAKRASKGVSHAVHDHGAGQRGVGDGADADAQRGADGGDGGLSRGARQGGRAARRQWPAAEPEGLADPVRGGQADGDRRAVRGDQGADRRLHADPGGLARGGAGMDAAVPRTVRGAGGRARSRCASSTSWRISRPARRWSGSRRWRRCDDDAGAALPVLRRPLRGGGRVLPGGAGRRAGDADALQATAPTRRRRAWCRRAPRTR